MSDLITKLDGLVAEIHACDAADDNGGRAWNGVRLAAVMRPLLPLLREWLSAEEETAPAPRCPEWASRIRRADYALRTALRSTDAPGGPSSTTRKGGTRER